VLDGKDCVRAGDTGSISVQKEAVYRGPIVLPSQTYPVTVTCGSNSTTLNLVSGVPQTVSNIPLNTNCSVVEGTVPTPANICPANTTAQWLTTVTPASPVTITGSAVLVTVQNELICEQTPTMYVTVEKVVHNNAPVALPAQTYPLVVTCGSVVTPTSLAAGQSENLGPFPLNTVCTTVEAPPPLPANVCPVRTTPMWSTTYAPSATMTVAISPVGTTVVTNTLNCVPVGAVPATRTECKPPMIPSGKSGTCVCPEGTIRKGDTCVGRRGNEQTFPRNDVIPGLPNPGGNRGNGPSPGAGRR
jgi:hypothetical protein